MGKKANVTVENLGFRVTFHFVNKWQLDIFEGMLAAVAEMKVRTTAEEELAQELLVAMEAYKS
jgi:hypothetical protein